MNDSSGNTEAKRKKLSRGAKIGIAIAVTAIIIAGGVLLYVSHVLGRIERIDPNTEHQMTPEEAEQYDLWDKYGIDDHSEDDTLGIPDYEPEEPEPDLNNADIKLVKDPDVKNILLIGVDSRTDSFAGRSDTMMVCSINKKTKSITLVSILRDLYVEIEGYGNNKLNASYAFGGTSLLNKTIERNLGIHIDYNVIINFNGFVNAMAEVGSIEISLSAEEAAYLVENHKSWKLKEGVNTLTPTQMLAYARIRKISGNDWGRTERQRKVIMAAFEKYRSKGISAILDLINRVTPYVKTDMKNSDMVNQAQTVISSGMTIKKAAAIPSGNTYTGRYVKGRSVLVPDMAAVSRQLHQLLYGVD